MVYHGLPFLIAWWIFPWQTVSHNQMVTFKLEKNKKKWWLFVPWKLQRCSMKLSCSSMENPWNLIMQRFFPQKKTQMSFPSEKQLFTPGWPPEVFPAVRRGPWPAPRHAAADPSVGTLLVPAVPSARLWQLTWKMLGRWAWIIYCMLKMWGTSWDHLEIVEINVCIYIYIYINVNMNMNMSRW